MEPARSVVQARGSFAPMDLPTSERRSLTGLYLCGAGARAAGGYRIRSSVASVVTWRVLAGRSPRTIDWAGCGARGCYDHLVGTVASSDSLVGNLCAHWLEDSTEWKTLPQFKSSST